MESMISCDSDSLQGFLKSLPIRFGVGSIGRISLLQKLGILCIICLTREPMARVHLAAGKYQCKIAPYLTRARALFFAYNIDNKSYYSAKHNHKLD